jgi:hypothetical protein
MKVSIVALFVGILGIAFPCLGKSLTFTVNEELTALAFSPDGEKVYAMGPSGIQAWDTYNAAPVTAESDAAKLLTVPGKEMTKSYGNGANVAVLRTYQYGQPAVQLFDKSRTNLLREFNLRETLSIANVIDMDITQDGQMMVLNDYSRHGTWWVDFTLSNHNVGLIQENSASARFSPRSNLIIVAEMISDSTHTINGSRLVFYDADSFKEIHRMDMHGGTWSQVPICATGSGNVLRIANLWYDHGTKKTSIEVITLDENKLATNILGTATPSLTQLWYALFENDAKGYAALTLFLNGDRTTAKSFVAQKIHENSQPVTMRPSEAKRLKRLLAELK